MTRDWREREARRQARIFEDNAERERQWERGAPLRSFRLSLVQLSNADFVDVLDAYLEERERLKP